MTEESTTPDPVELNRQMIEAETFDEWAMPAEQIYAPNAVWDVLDHSEARKAVGLET